MWYINSGLFFANSKIPKAVAGGVQINLVSRAKSANESYERHSRFYGKNIEKTFSLCDRHNIKFTYNNCYEGIILHV